MTVTYWGPGPAKERFQQFIDSPPGAVALDVETVSLVDRTPIGFALAFSPDEAIYFQVFPEEAREVELLKPLLCNPAVTKIAHNIIFDLGVLPLIHHLEHIDRSNIWDTSIAARFIGRDPVDLPWLSVEEELGIEVTAARSMLAGGKTMLDIDPAAVGDKCQRDARACFALYLKYKDEIDRVHRANFNIDLRTIPILIDMSQNGLELDHRARARLVEKYSADIEFYRDIVTSYGIENPGSAQQVGYVLAKRGNFLPTTKSKRQLSTTEANLEFLDDPAAAAIIGYRHATKFKSTYLDPLEHSDVFYTEYYIDTVVGRLNSRNRNIQNIPLDARQMIVPRHGCFTSVDYSQEHLYILMHFSGDRAMKRVYENGEYGGDIHVMTAEQMHITRRLAKVCNYAVCYGATAKTISEQTKIKDISICDRLLKNWFKIFSGAADWIINAQREGMRDGYALPTLFGRRVRLPLESDDSMRRKAVNYPILSSDGEVLKRAMLLCNERGLGPPTMAITVHDSLSFDGDVELPKEEIEMIPGFRIPVEVTKTLVWA